MKRAPFDMEQLLLDIEEERARIVLIPYADRCYKNLCRLLTKQRYHSNPEARKNTISRAVEHNKELRLSKAKTTKTIQLVS